MNSAVSNEFVALADLCSGVVTLVDRDETCRWVSPSVAQVLGWSPQHRVGQTWFELLHPDDVDAARAQLDELIAGGDQRGRLRPYRLRDAAGAYVWIESQLAIVGHPGATDGHDVVFVEREADELVLAAERARAAQEEQRARYEELEHVNRELERFAAVVTHDLAAPLLVVSNYATMLGGPGLTAEQADYIGRITRTVERMQRLIQDLRRFSLAEAPVEFAEVALDDVLEEVLETLAPLIDERRARVTAAGPMPRVRGDAGQLAQLLQNLISNAVKFGPAHDGEVRITAARIGRAWCISVADRGRGIELEDRERIFEPFRRLRGTGQLAGTGLGLTICQRVVKNHGGQLSLDSLRELGSTFSFTLPDPTEASETDGSGPRRGSDRRG